MKGDLESLISPGFLAIMFAVSIIFCGNYVILSDA